MIHYHGTPVGGSRQDVARFLMGRPAAALLLALIAGLVACESADGDPAQADVTTKPIPVETQR